MYETLEGEHIRLRKAREDDWRSMLAHVWSDEAVYRWMLFQPTLTEEDARDRARRSAAFQQEHFAWFVALKETDEAIGYCGMKEVEPGHFEESGICLGTQFQGRGYGREIVALLLDLAFLHLGAEDFRYSYFRENERSRRLAERFGFRYTHSYEITRPWDGTTFTSDSCLLTRGDYLAQREKLRVPAVRLEEVSPENWRADLHIREDQQRFVATREGALARAFAYRERRPQAYIIMEGETPVGLAMYYDSPAREAYYFSEFFIDERFQGQGLGRAAANLVLRKMRQDGRYAKVYLCYVDGDEPAKRLYESLGFRHTGEADGDEIVMELELPGGTMELRRIDQDDRGAIDDFLVQRWHSLTMVVHGERVDLGAADGFAAYDSGELVGLVTFRVADGAMEILSLDSVHEGRGIGGALLDAAVSKAREAGCARVWLITTNDNLAALRFYQRRGFDMVTLHRNAVAASRRLKPEIPLVAEDDIPLRHEIELELPLRPAVLSTDAPVSIGRKVIVVGSSGSGKSTFARRLHERTGLPLTHLDLLWWLPDATNVSREDFDRALDEVLSRDEWIIDGLYTRTLESRLLACDTVIFLDLPEAECLRGIEQRVGTKRPDIPWVEERVEPELVELVHDFHTRKRGMLLELFAQHPEKQVLTFTSRAEADVWLDTLPANAPDSVVIHEVELTDEVLATLIRFSEDWEAEGSCHGYRANTREDIEGNRIFLAEAEGKPIGYLFGHRELSQKATSIMPDGTPVFEVEELYVVPTRRSRGIGKALFTFAEQAVAGDAEYLMLSTATKNCRAILHFYLDEVGMQFWSARLFKRLDGC